MDKGTKIVKFKYFQQRKIEKQRKKVKVCLINKRIEVLEDDIDHKLTDLHTLIERREE